MLAVTFISLLFLAQSDQEKKEESLLKTHKESTSSSSSTTSINQFQVHSTLPMKKSTGISQKNKLPMEKMEQFQCCWSSLSMEKKKEFLVIKIQDLKDYLARNSSKKDMVIATLEESIAFGKMNHNQIQNHVSWEFWVCPLCDEIFTEEESHVQHILQSHVTSLAVLHVSLPSDDWINMIANGVWKPIDVPAALRIIQEAPIDDVENQEWPLCVDDFERVEKLESIRRMLTVLINNGSLTETNLESFMVLVHDELKNIIPTSHKSLVPKMIKSHYSICFLNASQLDDRLLFLGLLSGASQQVFFGDTFGSLDKSIDTALTAKHIQEAITFDENRSCLLLAERLLVGEILPQNCGVDPFIGWMFSGGLVKTETSSWTSQKAQKKKLGNEFFLALQKTSEDLHQWSETSRKRWLDEHSLREFEAICEAEKEMRDKDETYVHQSYESLLMKRLTENDVDTETFSSQGDVGLQVILKDAKALDIDDCEKESSTCMRKRAIDMKSTENPCQEDASIRMALKLKIYMCFVERNVMDAKILRLNALMKRMVDKFKLAAVLDYRAILLPYIQSFLKDRIHDLILNEANEKAKAAAESLLAEEEEDAKKNAEKGKCEKLLHRSSKAKKSNRNKKTMNEKGKNDDLLEVPQREENVVQTEENTPPQEEYSDWLPASAINRSGRRRSHYSNTQYRHEEEEEMKRKAEIEMRDRMMAEALQKQLWQEERQRMLEVEEEQKKMKAKAEHEK